jgi:KUP system potassium uptake protein
VWLRRLAQDLRLPVDEAPFIIREDNQGAIALIRDHRFSDRSKHIDIRYFYIREHVEQGTYTIEYCPTNLMLADVFTKALNRPVFVNIIKMLGMILTKSSSDKPQEESPKVNTDSEGKSQEE